MLNLSFRFPTLVALVLLAALGPLAAQLPIQEPQYRSAADLWLGLQRLRTVGTVLYVAAHPDDENTRLITWLTHQQHCRTAYHSLTRGDGGQNLIGKEIETQLGIIRTQELMAARRIDRGEQYFSRAYDFGFSKTPDETFRIWNREEVLEEMVLLIRSLRPDLIITRFSTEASGTHGHHPASTLLALEAWEAAADPKRFPDQLKTLKTWRAKRVVWNTSPFFFREKGGFKAEGYLTVDVGSYITPYGESVPEISARSRSQHKSQGFGSVGERGEFQEYFQHLAGQQAQKGLFEGIDLSWSRLPDGVALQRLAEGLIAEFNPAAPENIVPKLVQFYKRLETLEDAEWKRYKQAEVRALIAGCLGLYVHAVTARSLYAPGDSIAVNCEVIQRRGKGAIFRRVALPELKADSSGSTPLRLNVRALWNPKLILPALPASQPFWLGQPQRTGMFVVENKSQLCLPENPPALRCRVELNIEGENMAWDLPVEQRVGDPVRGEVRMPVAVGYPVYLSLPAPVRVFPQAQDETVALRVTAGQGGASANVRLRLPQGWSATPRDHRIPLRRADWDTLVYFQVKPPAQADRQTLVAEAQIGDKVYDRGRVLLAHEHINDQYVFPLAQLTVIRADLQSRVPRIGYLDGAGDQVADCLEQAGIQVERLNPQSLTLEQLLPFKAVMLGVRAYNTVKELATLQPLLNEYVQRGGNLIVQYTTNRGLVTENLAPYKLKIGRDRVTDETARMNFLDSNHPALMRPNPIGPADFEGWVQERGLYFASEWAREFTPVLGCNDPGEAELKGGLLVARFGQGHYVYTGLAFFRQLPSGVPGAYKLLFNLLSLE